MSEAMLVIDTWKKKKNKLMVYVLHKLTSPSLHKTEVVHLVKEQRGNSN